jgi:hypothetical protein
MAAKSKGSKGKVKSLLMGYSGETNDISFSSGTTAFYGFLVW